MNETADQATSKKSKIRRSESEWRGIIAEYEQSGQTQEAYCQGRGISLSPFHKWRRRLKGVVPGETPNFIEIKPKVFSSGGRTYEIVLGSGASLKVGSGYNASEVRELVEILKGTRC